MRFSRRTFLKFWRVITRLLARRPDAAKNNKLIWFAFANTRGFSGQNAATLLVIDGMRARGAECRCLPQPVRDRNLGRSVLEYARYILALLLAWGRSFVVLFRRDAWLHLSMGQTRFAFLRDSVPLLVGRIGLGRRRLVITLNGSLFMRWNDRSLDSRLFAALLRQAGTITVLGRRQRDRLIAMQVPEESIAIVPNSCGILPLSEEELAAKTMTNVTRPVRLLHLSSLIATKGYPEYLDALLQLSTHSGPRIEAVLCGRLIASEFADRFSTLDEAEKWIGERIVMINASSRVHAEWIRGAEGAAKTALFRDADIFVLPTCYPVEAQPLVLIEAMATGCAIVTTTVGEIEMILDTNSALFIPDTQAKTVAAAIARLVADSTERKRLARAARTRFVNELQLTRHIDLWATLFSEAND